ncbi:MAG: immunoglobulin-like domain-containing protein [Treponema sp.]
MKKVCNITNWRLSKAIIFLALFSMLLFACNQGNDQNKKPDEGKDSAKNLNDKTIMVHGKKVENGKVVISLEHATVTKDNIKVYFDKTDDLPEVLCDPANLSIGLGESKSLKIYTNATPKYNKFEKTITIEREDKKTLNPTKITIHNGNALSGKITIKESSVIKDDVKLEFAETDAPKDTFTISPQPFNPEKGKAKKLTITIAETAKYKEWKFEVDVKKAKEDSDPKDMDDAVEALQSQLSWAGSKVDSNITLPSEVAGIAGTHITWESLNKFHCTDGGNIIKDITNVKVELEATITFNSETRKVKFTTTIERIKQIREVRGSGTDQHTFTWDFSEENVLSLLKDAKPIAKFELKKFDLAQKQFVAKLKQKEEQGKLLDLEELFTQGKQKITKSYDDLFGSEYVNLKSKSVITWEEFKAFLLKAYGNESTEEEKIFKNAKQFPLNNYTGSLAEFKALSDAERTNIIKEALNKQKEGYSKGLGISKDLSDEQFLEALKKNVISGFLAFESKFEEGLYKYNIISKTSDPNYPDNLSFDATSIYDSQKKWYEQKGSYNYKDGNNNFSFTFGRFDDKLKVWLEIASSQNRGKFDSIVPISSANSFTFKYQDKTLNCAISNALDGKFTVTMTGAFSGTHEAVFQGTNIEKEYKHIF